MRRMANQPMAGAAAILSILVAWHGTAQAQSFPSKQITIVVPFAAGGPSDTMARLIADGMGQQAGARVLVENGPAPAGGLAAPVSSGPSRTGIRWCSATSERMPPTSGCSRRSRMIPSRISSRSRSSRTCRSSCRSGPDTPPKVSRSSQRWHGPSRGSSPMPAPVSALPRIWAACCSMWRLQRRRGTFPIGARAGAQRSRRWSD